MLIANRGEVALRIQRTCREMGIETVAVYSEADRDSMYVRLADEAVCIGPAPADKSYLNMPSMIAAAEITDAQAIHPGYGFLSERVAFAQMVQKSGFVFIGPQSDLLELMADKLQSKRYMQAQGFDVLSGFDCEPDMLSSVLQQKTDDLGYPVMIKARHGGAGRALGVVEKPEQLLSSFQSVQSQAKHLFKNDELYVERYLKHPRHIEVQVLGDGQGAAVCLGTRDCSVQRHHQKIIEQTAIEGIDTDVLMALAERCVLVSKDLNYQGLGTFEFLYDQGAFYFIEMNTRLQVEHTITEQVLGLDLVRLQIEAAMGTLNLEHCMNSVGHSKKYAMECRINAEHHETFIPSSGMITHWHSPGGLGVRVDSHLYTGYEVPPYYDSLIAKVVTEGRSRRQCIERMRHALLELVVEGIETNIPLLKGILLDPEFLEGQVDTGYLTKYLERL
ncbi:MAG: biotin carboxylase N-terminal domain-containing protein [Alcaligenaceae bacterium]|nr:biotin carboxylase N-terminal domain-containing protein [Alcaligenaceae bacterium]